MKNSTSNDAYDRILKAIISSELRPGDTVAEIQLAQKFGFGRTPVREAIMRLENEGFIVSLERKKKIYILFPKDIEEIFQIKQAIESMVASQASEKASPENKKELADMLAEMRLLKNGEESQRDAYVQRWLELDTQFHNLLFKIANNSRAGLIVNNLNLQFLRIKLGMLVLEERVEKSVREHLEIGEAIFEGRKEDAARLMYTHLETVKQTIIALMNTFYHDSL
ncbi:GntR family transcriptional regulator [Proteiniphilum acetatigenes]|uniref:GntR family transcriptional regulator n=1 Tax=Proteiniphilum acetatigenes TaxID=294710 RepID=UPI0003626BB3|nr:GntR family transcriptional regulator [Proteiniphilum acetatigenes]SFL27413.1 DNA-binding transcriptional regulator, GntR family [Porphyromonadaceae bacterium KH3CP3RA]